MKNVEVFQVNNMEELVLLIRDLLKQEEEGEFVLQIPLTENAREEAEAYGRKIQT